MCSLSFCLTGRVMQDWIVTFQIPEYPNEFASVVAHRKDDIPHVETWVKLMFGNDILVAHIIPLRPIDNTQSGE